MVELVWANCCLFLVSFLSFFGPSKLPSLAKSMGQAIAEFKKGAKEASKELEKMSEEVEKATDAKDE